MRMKVLMVSLEPLIPSTAIEAHVRGVFEGLRGEGVDTLLVAPLKRVSGVLHRSLNLCKWSLRAAAHVRRADIIYMRWHPFGVLVVLTAWIGRRPLVLEVNGTLDDLATASPWTRVLSGVLRRTTRWQFLRASHSVAVTTGIRDWIQVQSGDARPVSVIANAAPLGLERSSAFLATDEYAIFVGELAEWQGLDTLLDAVLEPQWPKNLTLRIVGDGRLQARVAECARSSNGAVVAHGRLPRPAAVDLLAKATVSISPQGRKFARNRFGVSPIKVAESLVLGVPVVLSDINAAARDVTEMQLGAVHTADDPGALASAVRHTVTAYRDAAHRERIRAWGLQNSTWESVARRTKTILEAEL